MENELGNEVDLEAEAEKFMKKQAELESGDTPVPVLEQAVGTESVPDEVAKTYCREIIEVIRDLDKYRDMTLGEILLTVAIDPRNREQQQGGMEVESEATRSELVSALNEVVDGKIPNDRIALKILWEEMIKWPGIVDDRKKKEDETRQKGVKDAGWREGQARPPIGRDASETPGSFADLLPDWVGYSYLYVLSAVPVLIALSVIAILFVNSLQ